MGPLPFSWLLPLPNPTMAMVDMAVDTDTVMAVDTVMVDTDTVDTTVERAPLLPNLKLMLMPLTTEDTVTVTPDTVMVTDTDTAMVDTDTVDTDTAVDTVTTVELLLRIKSLD